MNPAFVISTANELFRFQPEDIVFISADRNYSHLFTADGDEKIVVLQLGHIEENLARQLNEEATQFIRIGRGLIINRKYIYYINLQKNQLVLKSPNGKQHPLAVPHEPLVALKKIIETEIINLITP